MKKLDPRIQEWRDGVCAVYRCNYGVDLTDEALFPYESDPDYAILSSCLTKGLPFWDLIDQAAYCFPSDQNIPFDRRGKLGVLFNSFPIGPVGVEDHHFERGGIFYLKFAFDIYANSCGFLFDVEKEEFNFVLTTFEVSEEDYVYRIPYRYLNKDQVTIFSGEWHRAPMAYLNMLERFSGGKIGSRCLDLYDIFGSLGGEFGDFA